MSTGFRCTFADFEIDREARTFEAKQVVGHRILDEFISSNPERMDNGNLIYFSKNLLILVNTQTQEYFELKPNIDFFENTFNSAGFCNVSGRLFCLVVEHDDWKLRVRLFEVCIHENEFTAT